jgi:hypothetical protein
MSGLLDRIFVVAGAFLGSQIPAFLQQYMQRLAGHVEELNHQIAELQKIASYSGKSLDTYIQKFLASSDPDFFLQGEFMQTTVLRLQTLSQTLHDLKLSSIFMRPYIFLKEIQYPIAHSTYNDFQPSLNLNIESLSYTVLGILLGYVFYQTLAKLISACATQISSLFYKLKWRHS